MIYNPYNMWMVGEDRLIINDIADKQRTLKLFQFSGGELIQSVRSGRGPGEVSTVTYKRLTKYSNGDLLLWDAGRKRLMRYTSGLEYKTDISGEGLEGSIYQAGLINDSTLFTIDFTEEVLKVWRIKDNKVKEKAPLWSINRNIQKELSPLSNFTLLQTLFYTNYIGTAYIIFEFSSMVMAINEKGLVFINDEPDKIPLPPNDEQSEKSGRYSLPIMGKHPEGARDIFATDKFVYVLLNGETISKFQQMRYMANFETLIEITHHAERLLVYDRISGSFIREIKLKIPARQAKIQGEYLYLLTTLGRNPEIKRYKLSTL
jgi:hypothetical protein